MLQLLYAVIFVEMLMIMSFLFKTPLRNLVIITLNKVKRGRGPVIVKTVVGTVVTMLGSALYNIFKIQRRSIEGFATVDSTDQVLLSNHVLQASLLGFVLFLSLMIDRLHHYIRELRLLRNAVETGKKQNRCFQNNTNIKAMEHTSLKEEIGALRFKIEKLESECEVKGSRVKSLEIEVEAFKKQSEGFLMEYDGLLIDNQNLRKLLECIEKRSSYVDDKNSL
ncbi:putative B-cell receptor-associated protein 29/31 [Medicago truncatula]|uniref:Endoplasmic reticulum transmembrane protein n=1 Tax=Medicago truncatula TaxID=3880 RepID=A2Q4H3_MEDTR|nr:B-cell receptor-associated protein 31 [Medicago truncatula]ABN08523.1 Prefoldin [Medicago truncatula]AES67207.1 B-cell receptor-associated-like protein [Medicago truncatula]RHN75546.1 putative B-cell receptor-associated protein 29/31 [Medicago truncatula]